MDNRILLFIPVYNCEKQIARVLKKINCEVQTYITEIVIIDNLSTDNTVINAIEFIKELTIKTTILRNQENYNLGGSIKRAFLYALQNHFDYMIILHGDDQADIRDFLPILASGEYIKNDIVIGARFHPQSKLTGYSPIRRIGNRVLNVAYSIGTQNRVYDMIAGLNIFRIDFFKSLFFLGFPNNLTFDAHVLLYALDKRASVCYFPITWREEDQISNATVIRQALIILRLLGRYLLLGNKVFPEPPHTSENSLVSDIVWQHMGSGSTVLSGNIL